MVSELLIGARGWQHPQWAANFYPTDMPEEWRFTYYSNEFRTVLLAQSELLAAGPDALQEWCDDVGGEFSFFIDVDALDRWAACLQCLKPLRAMIGGFVLRPARCTVDELQQCVPGLQQWAPVCLDERLLSASDHALAQFIQQHQLGCCWDAQHAGPAWREGDMSVALLNGGFDMEARILRTVLENCLRGTRGKSRRALFILGEAGAAGDAPSIDTLRQAVMLRDLLE